MSAQPAEIAQDDCPCGTGRGFDECCQPILSGARPAKTCVGAMRALYSAYATGNADHILATEKGTSEADRPSVEEKLAKGEWRNFKILSLKRGKEEDSTGVITFVIGFLESRDDPFVSQMHEQAHFVRENGTWLYMRGQPLPRYRAKKKEACWCGSGKIAKLCHK